MEKPGNNLTEMIDLVVELIYNANGTTTIKDSPDDPNPETHTYDERGTLKVQTSESGGEQKKDYDANFRPELVSDALNNQTTLDWSDNGQTLRTSRMRGVVRHLLPIILFNQPISIKHSSDPLEHGTLYFYNNTNFPTLPTRIEYPLSFDNGTSWIGTDYEYYLPASGAAAGKVKFITETSRPPTYYTYTSTGQVESVTIAYMEENLKTTYTYDAFRAFDQSG